MLNPGGVLTLSGLELDEVEAVRRAFPPGEVRTKGGWALLAVRTASVT